jgi:ATP-dependent Clp protease ATP-binding subunit ClpA
MSIQDSDDEKKFRETVRNLRSEMKKVIFGQDRAIDALDRAVKISFSGLRTRNKTAGAFLFMGPTGSGKTETAEQLAKKLGVPCKKIDCGEFQHSHEVAKLIGSPPGYLGHRETTGVLTAFAKEIQNHRYGVLILDEIEKADPALSQMCLGLLDKATVTDGTNNTLKFNNVIVIMTSNVGERDRKRTKLGFAPQVAAGASQKRDPETETADETGKKVRALDRSGPAVVSTGKGGELSQFNKETLRQVFSPEFLGRLDGVVNFTDLSREFIPQIAARFVDELKEQARDNPKGRVNLDITPAALDYIVESGYKPEKGARSLSYYLDEAIVHRLAEEMLDGALQGGGDARVDLREDPLTHVKALSFAFNEAARGESAPPAPGQPPAPPPPPPSFGNSAVP